MFEGFKEAHGFDTPDDSVYYPISGENEQRLNFELAEFLFQPWRAKQIPKELKTEPEYAVAKALFEQGKDRFTGMEFLQAAAVLDEEFREPKRAWNCLVNAGYWAGKNLPEGQETIVKAAIYLCEKHNWLEAAEVLKYNLDIMQSV